MGDRGGERRAGTPPRRRPRLRAGDGREPAHRRPRPRARGSRAPGCPPRGPAGAGPVGRGSVRRPRPEPARAGKAAGARAPGPRLPGGCRPRHVALLRELHGPRGPRASRRQLPGDPRAPGRPSDLADQHRDGAPRHPGRPRPRLHRPGRPRGEGRRHPHHDGGPGAARGAPAQLVRHAEPGSAPAALRLDGRQREPGGCAHGARRGSARGGPAGSRGARFGFRGRHGLPLPLRPAAPDPLDRLSTGGRRGAGTPRPLVLRPAGLGGAPRELRRHRPRRAPGDALVPPRPAGHERPRHADPPVLERHRLRVPDAAAPHEELSRDAARPQLPPGGAPPGRVRRRAGRALGDLRVRLQPRRSPRQLPVQGLRRPRPRPEAGPRRRAGGGALRDRARRDGGAAARGAQPAAPLGRRPGGGLRLLRGDRLHPRGGRRPGRRRDRRPLRRNRRARLHGPPPGHDARLARQRPPRQPDGEALPRRSARAGHGAAAAGAGAAHGGDHPAPPGGGDARGRPRARAGGASLPVAAHPVAPRAVPLERHLHHGGDQLGRRRQLLPRSRRHPPPRGPDARPGEPVPLPPRRAQRGGVVRDPPPDGDGRGRRPGDLPRREGVVQPAPRRHRVAPRRRGLDRGRRRGAAAGADEPQRPPPRDRDHELRRDRARPGDGRPGPPRLREAVRRDGVPPGASRAAVRAPAALARRARGCGPFTS